MNAYLTIQCEKSGKKIELSKEDFRAFLLALEYFKGRQVSFPDSIKLQADWHSFEQIVHDLALIEFNA